MSGMSKGYDHQIAAQAIQAARSTGEGHSTALSDFQGPDLARLNDRFAAILSEAGFNRNRIDAALARLGRPQPDQNEAACSPCRSGAIGAYEDRLDELGALGENIRIIANVLEQIV